MNLELLFKRQVEETVAELSNMITGIPAGWNVTDYNSALLGLVVNTRQWQLKEPPIKDGRAAQYLVNKGFVDSHGDWTIFADDVFLAMGLEQVNHAG